MTEKIQTANMTSEAEVTAASYAKRASKELIANLKQLLKENGSFSPNLFKSPEALSQMTAGLSSILSGDASPTLEEIVKISHLLGATAIMTITNNNGPSISPMPVKLLHEKAKLPAYGKPGDAGLDLYAIEDVIVPAWGSAMARTGIAISLPSYAVGLIWPRSGTSVNNNIETGAGVIDHTFRGEIIVKLYNFSDIDYKFEAGHRVAQLILNMRLSVEPKSVPELDESVRGEKGFGSSGK